MDYNFLCGSSNIDDEQRLIAEPISFRNRGVSRKIYNDAFPKEDRMPFWLMPTMAKGRATEMHVYRDGDAYCGMDYVASLDGTTFVMFLAVDGRMRSRGYGGMILDRIKSDPPDDLIIVSFEPPVEGEDGYEVRLRRKRFYLRNGFRETGYVGVLGGKSQEIMVFNGEFDPHSWSSSGSTAMVRCVRRYEGSESEIDRPRFPVDPDLCLIRYELDDAGS